MKKFASSTESGRLLKIGSARWSWHRVIARETRATDHYHKRRKENPWPTTKTSTRFEHTALLQRAELRHRPLHGLQLFHDQRKRRGVGQCRSARRVFAGHSQLVGSRRRSRSAPTTTAVPPATGW
jgi:hypothetical protein